MKKVKVSLREIMEDDNSLIMQSWVNQIQPKLDKIISDQSSGKTKPKSCKLKSSKEK